MVVTRSRARRSQDHTLVELSPYPVKGQYQARVVDTDHSPRDMKSFQFTDDDDDDDADDRARPNWRTDKGPMALLILLYMLQGIPMGLSWGSIPFMLQERVSMSETAVFGLSAYPYSLKLAWSPIVDSVWRESIGRRKSWIVPMQLGIGCVFLYLSSAIETMMVNGNIVKLSTIFLCLIVVVATQDIAVDGWALTMLQKRNLSYASTCQNFGLTMGYFTSYTIFLALNSYNYITLSGFLFFWGSFYLIFTTILWALKRERPYEPDPTDPDEISIKGTYQKIGKVLRLPAVRQLILVLLIVKIPFMTSDAILPLRLLRKGIDKKHLATLALAQFPFDVLSSVLAGRWAHGNQPLRPYMVGYAARIFMLIFGPILLYTLPEERGFGTWAFIVFISFSTSFANTLIFVTQGAFFNRISDPAIGGSYLTLLNTFANLGGTWPRFFVMVFADYITVSPCYDKVTNAAMATVSCAKGTLACTEAGGRCVMEFDGYYVVFVLCMLYGLWSYTFMRRKFTHLQSLGEKDWRTSIQGSARGV